MSSGWGGGRVKKNFMTSLSGGWERIENLSGGLEIMTWPGKRIAMMTG